MLEEELSNGFDIDALLSRYQNGHLKEEIHEKKQVDTKEPWTTFGEEKNLEPEIEEFLTCLSPDPLCIQETNDLKEGELHGMVEEDDSE